MLQTILNSFAVPEIRRKLLFTAAMLALYRLGAYIPAPGIDVDTVKNIEDNFAGNNILGFLCTTGTSFEDAMRAAYELAARIEIWLSAPGEAAGSGVRQRVLLAPGAGASR